MFNRQQNDGWRYAITSGQRGHKVLQLCLDLDVDLDIGHSVQQVVAGFLWVSISNYTNNVAHGFLFNNRVPLRESGSLREATQHDYTGLHQACDAHR